MRPRQIYLLSPKELSPETIAVAFAKTSRSPESFREIAAGLTEESSARFNEKWVVGYGHASVAEHAVLHIAIENVSRLAVESIESNRLASYTEKSTRYQKWDAQAFFIPPELEEHPLKDEFINACSLLFETYQKALPVTRAVVEKQVTRKDNETDDAFDRRIRSHYADACRFLLPAASLANLGMTANARTLEHAITKMLSHPLAEVRQIGLEIRETAQREVPTLVKYAEAAPYLVETRQAFEELDFHTGSGQKEIPWCSLVDFDPKGEDKVLTAALYRFNGISYQEAMKKISSASSSERENLARFLLEKFGDHDTPLRELEHTAYTFDIIIDQGGYVELKRHRMMTQTPQELTTRLGYAVPKRLLEAGLEDVYHSVMERVAHVFEIIADWNPHVAAYVVPNGYKRRVLLTMNLREAFAFCQLRTAANAHFSMRRMAGRIAEEIQRVHPLMGNYLRLSTETWQEVEDNNFSQF